MAVYKGDTDVCSNNMGLLFKNPKAKLIWVKGYRLADELQEFQHFIFRNVNLANKSDWMPEY